MKKIILLTIAVLFSVTLSAQKIALKNNLLYDATTTPNLALEFALGKHTTLEIGGGWNPWEFKDDKQLKHWMVQPELRFWTCESFNGFFFGFHGHGGEYNAGGIDLPFGLFPHFEHYRYDGHFYGGGASVGYQFVMGRRWNFEISVGGGYIHFDYKKYSANNICTFLGREKDDYWGVTRATISFAYFFK